MAKRAASATEQRIEEFAEDLGRLLGAARVKAEGWLGQRKQIAKTLEGIRDTAGGLLAQLGHEAERVGRGMRSAGAAGRGRAAGVVRRKRPAMSPAQRKAVSERMRKYWAARRKEEKP